MVTNNLQALKDTLNTLRQFVEDEQTTQYAQLFDLWEKPIQQKLQSGESQQITRVRQSDKHYLTLTLGDNESRLREGDMICLHTGAPLEKRHVAQATIEAEFEDEWLVRMALVDEDTLAEISAGCYADPDTMDLKPFYDKALDEIAESAIGREVVLPLLAGQLNAAHIFEDNYDDAADMAEEAGCNEQQIDAVGKGVAAKYLACIQGPPGTGKTRVISLIAQQLVAEGHRVLVTSHTHMAINNALNKIAATGVPLVKVGAHGCLRGLDSEVPYVESGSRWRDKPDGGYVIGATPFATCSSRLENFQFDTVIFDEASQVTVPLALMAMRKAKRFVFVGDHKQLPPVVLSAPVLTEHSVFGKLVAMQPAVSVMLTQTYRMCQDLARWPGEHYYDGKLVAVGANAQRRFSLLNVPQKYAAVLSEAHPLVFIRSPGVNARQFNRAEAQQVAAIVEQAIAAGLISTDIGVVTPFRSHAKALKAEFARRNIAGRRDIVTDTVERMQGQEREMIILSLCANDPQYLTAITAFFFQAQRLNVAITRPQTKLIIFGPLLDKGFAFDCDDAVLLRQIADYRSLLAAAWHAPLESE